mmetsp:Transcript_55109/g.159549  ORF Transcript_55109/g.159549 Transcript_55109/m.159549 type:complete len:716 (-) Transcript_55109:79-2226(-)
MPPCVQEAPPGRATAFHRASLAAWLARLRYLHSLCGDELLQALILSRWGGVWASRKLSPVVARRQTLLPPRPADVLAGLIAEGFGKPRGGPASTSELLRLRHAAQAGRGDFLELAICLVALFRSLGMPARLVLAFGLGSWSELKDAGGPGVADEDVDQEQVRRLVSLGFDAATVTTALQQACSKSPTERFQEAAAFLMRLSGEMSKDMYVLPAPMAHGSAPGDDGDEVAAPISVWLEAYDINWDRWVAVDPTRLEVLKNPATQWMHRGTPMIWVCSADDQLLGERVCFIRDVTHRYAPMWWRVEQARGPPELLEWWHTALTALSCPGAADDGARHRYARAAAAQADAKDVAKLLPRRAHRPRNSGHILGYQLGEREVMRPGAVSVDIVGGHAVFRKTDVAPAKTAMQWRVVGRVVKPGEAPCKYTLVCGKSFALFGEWQTQPDPKFKRTEPSALGRPEPSVPTTGSARQKTKPKAKTGKRSASPLIDFDARVAQLEEWMRDRRCMPWAKGSSRHERRLAAWAEALISPSVRSCMTEEQAARLQSLPGWDWRSAAERMEEEAFWRASATLDWDFQEDVDEPEQEEEDDHDVNLEEQWVRLTIQRVANELAKVRDAPSKRTFLRSMQLCFHPDKNPGRSDEVLPIFHFIQQCWCHEFRQGEVRAPGEGQGDEEAAEGQAEDHADVEAMGPLEGCPNPDAFVDAKRRRCAEKYDAMTV